MLVLRFLGLALASLSFSTAFVPPTVRSGLASATDVSPSACKAGDSAVETMSLPKWFQHEISITAPSRGCHLITSDILKVVNKVCDSSTSLLVIIRVMFSIRSPQLRIFRKSVFSTNTHTKFY